MPKNININVIAHELKPGSRYLILLKRSNFSHEDADELNKVLNRIGIKSVSILMVDENGVKIEILPKE